MSNTVSKVSNDVEVVFRCGFSWSVILMDGEVQTKTWVSPAYTKLSTAKALRTREKADIQRRYGHDGYHYDGTHDYKLSFFDEFDEQGVFDWQRI